MCSSSSRNTERGYLKILNPKALSVGVFLEIFMRLFSFFRQKFQKAKCNSDHDVQDKKSLELESLDVVTDLTNKKRKKLAHWMKQSPGEVDESYAISSEILGRRVGVDYWLY